MKENSSLPVIHTQVLFSDLQGRYKVSALGSYTSYGS